MRFAFITAVKELRALQRDPFAFAAWVGIPFCIALLFSLVFSGGRAVPQGLMLVADQDKTLASNLLTGAFSRDPLSGMLRLEKVDEAAGRARINRGDGSAYLQIPRGFQRALLRNEPCRLLLLTNPSQRIVPKIVEETLSAMTDGAFYLQKVAGRQLREFDSGQAPSDEQLAGRVVELRRVGESAGRYLAPPLIQVRMEVAAEKTGSVNPAALFLPGMVFMALMMMANGLAGDIWKERLQGTLRRLAVTPASLAGFLAGRLASVALLYVAMAAVGVVAARWMAGLPVANLPAAVLWAAFTGMAFYLVLLLLALYATSERTSNVLGNLVVFPLAMLGGCFFPFEVMPAGMAAIGRMTPNGWAIVQFRAILAGTAGASHLAAAMAGIAVMGGAAYLLALRRLRSGFLA